MAGETVLLVDDEEMVTASLRGFLQLETSYRVLTCNAPQDALRMMQDERVDVVVADYMMPDLDGIEFLRRCRDLRPLASRILLTGYADKQNAIRAINEAGLYYYLEKPWSNEHLLMVVRNGIERSSLFSELDARVAALEQANEELTGMRRRLIQAFL
jgi:putative two-component system response regulator